MPFIFTKTGNGGTDKVWFYDMKAEGLRVRMIRQPKSDKMIPDIIERFHHLEKEAERQRTDQSFFVPVAEIKEKMIMICLSINIKIEYEKVEYEPTQRSS